MIGQNYSSRIWLVNSFRRHFEPFSEMILKVKLDLHAENLYGWDQATDFAFKSPYISWLSGMQSMSRFMRRSRKMISCQDIPKLCTQVIIKAGQPGGLEIHQHMVSPVSLITIICNLNWNNHVGYYYYFKLEMFKLYRNFLGENHGLTKSELLKGGGGGVVVTHEFLSAN